jgi:hypothetical protein
MPVTYEKISSTVLATASATVDVTSIPQTYTDLRVVIWVPNYSGSNYDSFCTFNNDSGNKYKYNVMNQANASAPNALAIGTSTLATSINYSIQTIYTDPTYPFIYTWDIFNYADNTFRRSMIMSAMCSETNSTGNMSRIGATYSGSAGISSFQLTVGGGQTYSAGTRVTLYGILRA